MTNELTPIQQQLLDEFEAKNYKYTYAEFREDIIGMNAMYRLENYSTQSSQLGKFAGFLNTFSEELTEIHPILAEYNTTNRMSLTRTAVDVLDLLADLMVYVASEAVKFDILPDHLPWFYGKPYRPFRQMGLEVVTEKIAYIYSVVVDAQLRATTITRLYPQEGMIDEFAHVFDTVVQQVQFCCFDIGVNLAPTLWAVMQANKSKLGADGKPIYDENGKFLKGPNTWKPEGMIRQIYQFG